MGRPPTGQAPLPRQGWTVKGADRDLTQRLRIQAIRERRTVGDCLNEALRVWLDSRSSAEGANAEDFDHR